MKAVYYSLINWLTYWLFEGFVFRFKLLLTKKSLGHNEMWLLFSLDIADFSRKMNWHSLTRNSDKQRSDQRFTEIIQLKLGVLKLAHGEMKYWFSLLTRSLSMNHMWLMVQWYIDAHETYVIHFV